MLVFQTSLLEAEWFFQAWCQKNGCPFTSEAPSSKPHHTVPLTPTTYRLTTNTVENLRELVAAVFHFFTCAIRLFTRKIKLFFVINN